MSAPELGAAPTAAPEPEPTWQRPHPLTLVGEIVGAVPTFIALVFFIRIGAEDTSGLLFEVLFILGPVITGAARYFTTRFAVGAHTLHLRRGLLVRQKQAMPRSNIQNVSSSAGIVGRVLGLSEVKVSDASGGAEITIRYLDTAGADALVRALRPTAVVAPPPPSVWGQPAPAPVTTSSQPEGRVLKVADNVELIRAEAARLVPAMVGMFPVVAVGMALWSSRGGVSFGWGLGSAGSLIGVALFLALSQGVSAFFALTGFTLSADADGFRTRQGAFTEVRNNARRDRIQLVRVHDDLLLRGQNLERVSYDTADAGARAGATSYLSPAGPRGEWRRLVAEVLEPSAAVEPDLTAVDRLTIRRTWVRWAAAGVLLLPLGLLHPLVAVLAIAVWGVAGYLYGPARWRLLGYDLGPTYLVVRTGVIAHRLWLIRADKIQAVTLDATYFQRRLGLASVRVACAGRLGALTIPDMSAADARDLFERLSVRSAATPLAATI